MFFYYYYIYIKESNHKGKNMKNTLAENLLRFGVKNLSESEKQSLQEQADPAWIIKLGKDIGQYTGNPSGQVTMKVKPGSKLTTQSTYASVNNAQDSVLIMPKGTTWTASPSGLYMVATGVTVPRTNFGYNSTKAPGEAFITGLKDSVYMANVAAGKGKDSTGNPLKPIPHNVLFTPEYEGFFVDGFMGGFGGAWPNRNIINALQKFS
jgi:hypothetical protein